MYLTMGQSLRHKTRAGHAPRAVPLIGLLALPFGGRSGRSHAADGLDADRGILHAMRGAGDASGDLDGVAGTKSAEVAFQRIVAVVEGPESLAFRSAFDKDSEQVYPPLFLRLRGGVRAGGAAGLALLRLW